MELRTTNGYVAGLASRLHQEAGNHLDKPDQSTLTSAVKAEAGELHSLEASIERCRRSEAETRLHVSTFNRSRPSSRASSWLYLRAAGRGPTTALLFNCIFWSITLYSGPLLSLKIWFTSSNPVRRLTASSLSSSHACSSAHLPGRLSSRFGSWSSAAISSTVLTIPGLPSPSYLGALVAFCTMPLFAACSGAYSRLAPAVCTQRGTAHPSPLSSRSYSDDYWHASRKMSSCAIKSSSPSSALPSAMQSTTPHGASSPLLARHS